MINLVFEEVKNNNIYILKDENQMTYELMFQFFNIQCPQKGDKILFPKELLKVDSKKYAQPYSYELQPKLSQAKLKNNLDEYVVLRIDQKNYVLKRIYG